MISQDLQGFLDQVAQDSALQSQLRAISASQAEGGAESVAQLAQSAGFSFEAAELTRALEERPSPPRELELASDLEQVSGGLEVDWFYTLSQLLKFH